MVLYHGSNIANIKVLKLHSIYAMRQKDPIIGFHMDLKATESIEVMKCIKVETPDCSYASFIK